MNCWNISTPTLHYSIIPILVPSSHRLLGRLIRKVLQILLDQGAVLLRIFFGLRLLDGRPVALGEAGELSRPCRAPPRPIGAAIGIPITLPAIALQVGSPFALSLTFPLTLALTLTLTLTLALALCLTLPLAIGGHGSIRIQPGLG